MSQPTGAWGEDGSWDTGWGGGRARTTGYGTWETGAARTPRPASQGDSWVSARSAGTWSSNGVHSYRPTEQPRPVRKTAASAARPAPSAGPSLHLECGDAVQHDAFGKGEVLSVQPMSGDALVSIQFEGEEKPRRLMLKYAGTHMKKL